MNTNLIPNKQRVAYKDLFFFWVMAIFIVLGFSTPLIADDKLCANSNINIGGVPNINGVIEGDNGWNSSNLYTFDNGSVTPHARVRMVSDVNALYLGFEINNDPTFDDADIIIVTLAPTANALNHRRIHIFPVAETVGNALTSPGGPPRDVKYWTDSSGDNANWTSSTPQWLTRNADGSCKNICVTSSSAALANKSYFVEMKIPISANADLGVDLPTAGDYGLYLNIIRVKPGANAGTKEGLEELHWPSTAPLISANPATRGTRVETNTPLVATWGQSNLKGPCAGISVSKAGTNATYKDPPNKDQPRPDTINVDKQTGNNNIFSVDLINTGSADGIGVTAQLLTAKFGLAGPNEYVPYPYYKVPLTDPPQPHPYRSPWSPSFGPSGIIKANNGTATIPTPSWDFKNKTNEYRDYYKNIGNVCSKVVLSTAPTTNGSKSTTLISNRIYQANMHFGTPSPKTFFWSNLFFEHYAVLGTRGYKKPINGNLQRFQLLVSNEIEQVDYTDHHERTFTPENIRMVEKDTRQPFERAKKMSILRKTVCGYRYTDRQVIIAGTTVDMLESANCYGYLISYPGVIEKWLDLPLTGPGLKQDQKQSNLYTISVEDGKSVNLTTRIEAVKPHIITPDQLALWQWLLLFLVILLLLLILFWRKPNP